MAEQADCFFFERQTKFLTSDFHFHLIVKLFIGGVMPYSRRVFSQTSFLPLMWKFAVHLHCCFKTHCVMLSSMTEALSSYILHSFYLKYLFHHFYKIKWTTNNKSSICQIKMSEEWNGFEIFPDLTLKLIILEFVISGVMKKVTNVKKVWEIELLNKCYLNVCM